MSHPQREQNIEKNKEFDEVVKRNFKKSLIISAIAVIIAFFNMSFSWTFVAIVITTLAICGISFILKMALDAEGCQECAAKWHEEVLSDDLLSEQFIGNKTVKPNPDSVTRQMRGAFHGGINFRDDREKTYAVFNRKYLRHSHCVYCGYEWTEEHTEKEQEEL